MLHQLARTLLDDLTAAGAVLGPGGELLEANEAFKTCFFEGRPDAPAFMGQQVRKALQRLAGTSRHGTQAVTLQRGGQNYRLDVYFLDKPDGSGALRLVIAAPAASACELSSDGAGAGPDAPGRLAPPFLTLIGQDASFRQALLLAQRAARTDLPVLILGESGTGKEILARTIHQASRRRKKPFVDVNCAALPDSLVESELFGYEKGAFTGASAGGKAGYFESADRGTIFMDEIGEAAPQTQAKLLRVLESGQFKRIGSNRNVSVDVRLVAATNQELSRRIAEGRFRADLLYRINTITIRLLPLRERLSDLPLLAEHFLQSANGGGKGPLRISREAFELLRAYSWPGNVRELKGVIDYAVTMTSGKILTPRSFPGFLRATASPAENRPAPGEAADTAAAAAEPGSDSLAAVIERAEARHIRKVLEASSNRSEAIRRLGISRRTFYAKLRQYGLE